METIELNQWHNIKFYRSERLGHLMLDSGVPSLGFSPGPHTIMTLYGNLYIGGVPNESKHEVNMNAGTYQPFRGYIQRVSRRDWKTSL